VLGVYTVLQKKSGSGWPLEGKKNNLLFATNRQPLTGHTSLLRKGSVDTEEIRKIPRRGNLFVEKTVSKGCLPHRGYPVPDIFELKFSIKDVYTP